MSEMPTPEPEPTVLEHVLTEHRQTRIGLPPLPLPAEVVKALGEGITAGGKDACGEVWADAPAPAYTTVVCLLPAGEHDVHAGLGPVDLDDTSTWVLSRWTAER